MLKPERYVRAEFKHGRWRTRAVAAVAFGFLGNFFLRNPILQKKASGQINNPKENHHSCDYYTLSYENKIYIIENVPARVCEETGEQYFAPETVEHIHEIIRTNKKPDKIIEAPVYEYA